LSVNSYYPPVGKPIKGNATSFTVKAEDDTTMPEALSVQAIGDIQFIEKVNRILFKQACTRTLLNIFAATAFQNPGIDPCSFKQQRQR
jgi:hypothetical protein